MSNSKNIGWGFPGSTRFIEYDTDTGVRFDDPKLYEEENQIIHATTCSGHKVNIRIEKVRIPEKTFDDNFTVHSVTFSKFSCKKGRKIYAGKNQLWKLCDGSFKTTDTLTTHPIKMLAPASQTISWFILSTSDYINPKDRQAIYSRDKDDYSCDYLYVPCLVMDEENAMINTDTMLLEGDIPVVIWADGRNCKEKISNTTINTYISGKTRILTNKGVFSVEEIAKINSTLKSNSDPIMAISRFENLGTIKCKKFKQSGKLYKLILSNGNTVICGAKQKWPIIDPRNGKMHYYDVKDIYQSGRPQLINYETRSTLEFQPTFKFNKHIFSKNGDSANSTIEVTEKRIEDISKNDLFTNELLRKKYIKWFIENRFVWHDIDGPYPGIFIPRYQSSDISYDDVVDLLGFYGIMASNKSDGWYFLGMNVVLLDETFDIKFDKEKMEKIKNSVPPQMKECAVYTLTIIKLEQEESDEDFYNITLDLAPQLLMTPNGYIGGN